MLSEIPLNGEKMENSFIQAQIMNNLLNIQEKERFLFFVK